MRNQIPVKPLYLFPMHCKKKTFTSSSIILQYMYMFYTLYKGVFPMQCKKKTFTSSSIILQYMYMFYTLYKGRSRWVLAFMGIKAKGHYIWSGTHYNLLSWHQYNMHHQKSVAQWPTIYWEECGASLAGSWYCEGDIVCPGVFTVRLVLDIRLEDKAGQEILWTLCKCFT